MTQEAGTIEKHETARKIYDQLSHSHPKFYDEQRFKDPKFDAEKNIPEAFSKEYRNGPQIRLLDKKTEEFLFMHLNWAKSKLWETYQRLPTGILENRVASLSSEYEECIQKILFYWEKVKFDENWIATANIPLVYHFSPNQHNGEFNELLSESHLALLRAIRGFDYRQGYKFSSYLVKSIKRAIEKYKSKIKKRQQREILVDISTNTTGKVYSDNLVYNQPQDNIEKRSTSRLLAKALTERILNNNEVKVMLLRFPQDSEEKKQTLGQIGIQLGLTRGRVRQIQNGGLTKLRNYLEDVLI